MHREDPDARCHIVVDKAPMPNSDDSDMTEKRFCVTLTTSTQLLGRAKPPPSSTTERAVTSFILKVNVKTQCPAAQGNLPVHKRNHPTGLLCLRDKICWIALSKKGLSPPDMITMAPGKANVYTKVITDRKKGNRSKPHSETVGGAERSISSSKRRSGNSKRAGPPYQSRIRVDSKNSRVCFT